MNSNGGGSIPLPDLRTQHVFEPMRLSREPLRGWYPRVAIDFVLSHLDTRGYRRFSGAAALPGARELSPTDGYSLRLDPDGCLMRIGLPI